MPVVGVVESTLPHQELLVDLVDLEVEALGLTVLKMVIQHLDTEAAGEEEVRGAPLAPRSLAAPHALRSPGAPRSTRRCRNRASLRGERRMRVSRCHAFAEGGAASAATCDRRAAPRDR